MQQLRVDTSNAIHASTPRDDDRARWWNSERIQSRMVVGTRVDGMNYARAIDQIVDWARAGQSKYVCISTVHMVMEGHDDPAYQAIVNGADLVSSDGMPLVWALRLLGVKDAERVYGPHLTPMLCERAASEGIPVGFYGSTDAVLDRMIAKLKEQYPQLNVAYQHCPPFRPLTEEEVTAENQAIESSGARIIFVGLGCPKQERWMSSRRDNVNAVMIGVGAAFDYVAETKPQAPRWMQARGLEWLFRLVTEPRRLWKRYLYHNPRFVALFLVQLIRHLRGAGK